MTINLNMTASLDAPESIDAAQAELARIVAWGETFTQMQAQLPQAQARAAFLQGWLSGQPTKPIDPPTSNRAARRAKGPTKKAVRA